MSSIHSGDILLGVQSVDFLVRSALPSHSKKKLGKAKLLLQCLLSRVDKKEAGIWGEDRGFLSALLYPSNGLPSYFTSYYTLIHAYM